MRKQTKLVAVMSAAALLAIGASMTSFAATKGWVEENGVWVYLDSDGDRVTEEWKKSGSQYFWLDENGEMAVEVLVEDDEDKYFVDANGARVINQWRQVDNEDGWSNGDNDEPETVWYYFGSNGKAVNGKKTINGKTYIFDETSEMFSGWTDYESNGTNRTYYLGEENEGWAYTGWQWLEVPEEVDHDEDEAWFNFKSSGEMRKADASKEEVKRVYIGGAYYGFDADGIMVDGWRPDGDKTATNAVYYTDENGNQPKGWVFTWQNLGDDKEDEDQKWYYLNSKGKPFNVGGNYSDDNNSASASTGTAQKYVEDKVDGGVKGGVAAKYIKKKSYLFGNDGVMMTGIYDLTNVHRVGGNTGTLNGIYYFNKNSGSVNGQMETGKVTVNYDGENYYYYFEKSSGAAFTNAIVDSCLYGENGARVNADEGKEIYVTEFAAVERKSNGKATGITVPAGSEVVVSTSGKLKKNGTVTIDGQKWSVKDYVATMVD